MHLFPVRKSHVLDEMKLEREVRKKWFYVLSQDAGMSKEKYIIKYKTSLIIISVRCMQKT